MTPAHSRLHSWSILLIRVYFFWINAHLFALVFTIRTRKTVLPLYDRWRWGPPLQDGCVLLIMSTSSRLVWGFIRDMSKWNKIKRRMGRGHLEERGLSFDAGPVWVWCPDEKRLALTVGSWRTRANLKAVWRFSLIQHKGQSRDTVSKPHRAVHLALSQDFSPEIHRAD